eukprot:3789393-Pyramimonas_sp.AAC.1
MMKSLLRCLGLTLSAGPRFWPECTTESPPNASTSDRLISRQVSRKREVQLNLEEVCPSPGCALALQF